MSHAAHKAPKAARAKRTNNSTSASALFVPAVDLALAAKLNEVAPMTRRAMRQAAKATARRNHMMAGSAIVALFGTAAGAIAFANPLNGSAALAESDQTESVTAATAITATSGVASRSESRKALPTTASTEAAPTEGSGDGDAAQDSGTVLDDSMVSGSDASAASWSMGDDSASLDVSKMSKSAADNPVVAQLMDANAADLPEGFNPNHATNDYGSSYSFSQCTWWVYIRRHQLGLPVGTHYGNGHMWADSARALGYWVDNTPRNVGDIMVFRQGQEGASSQYGHVAIVEAINPDGSVTTSECGASYNGRTFSRTFTNVHDFQYIHY
ncbi:CHAP domain-containing protein [Bifidobacterium avesanii]|uniref:CHAP domain-containing protein n=1 Tax=Bifidobacterium avesanii TaxID=1798157 RepID=A0A7K3TG43_9BIFI|nr:CHAP domain-containing protein [Bifidobacterium avesanii]KAB8294546.1 amidase [Bifidobacterium avesanii]NEG78058.1 CHAP domain-containing protein [Bifidobacterium avesanii]